MPTDSRVTDIDFTPKELPAGEPVPEMAAGSLAAIQTLTEELTAVAAPDATPAVKAAREAMAAGVSPGFVAMATAAAMGVADTALPAWLADADAEERRELEELGALAVVDVATEAARDELISRMLRVHHEHTADVERYDEAEKLEHERITQRYDRLRRPAKSQMLRLALFILHMIEGATFTGRKRSRNVGWGSYGVRKQPDKVVITDAPVCTAAVYAVDPASVKVKIETDGKLGTVLDAIITSMIMAPDKFGNLDGATISDLSAFRAQLRAADRSVGLTAVGKLIHTGASINGAEIQYGRDKAWFESEVPTPSE